MDGRNINKRAELVILSLILILILGTVLAYTPIFRSPVTIMKYRLHTSMPVDAKVLHYEYHGFKGYFAAQFLLGEDDVPFVEKQLTDFFKIHCVNATVEVNTGRYMREANSVRWWEPDMNKVSAYYSATARTNLFLVQPRSPTSGVPVYVYITKQNEGEYYLYVYI